MTPVPNVLKEMLLIEEPGIMLLYKELIRICSYFVAPLFSLSVLFEYFSDWNFSDVIRRLFIIVLFMAFFQGIQVKAVDVSFDTALATLKKVSPANPFIKKWYHPKIKTTEKSNWNFIQKILTPDLNDLLGTAFYLLARVCVWLLKLIYSTVYHFTYIFSGVTALLYFFKWTEKGLKGTVQSFLWCLLMPFVVMAIFVLVGNGLSERAMNGEIVAGDIETILWLFGVTLVLLLSPLLAWSMVKGEGVAAAGAQIGKMATKGIMGTAVATTMLGRTYQSAKYSAPARIVKGAGNTVSRISSRLFGKKESSTSTSNSKLESMKGQNSRSEGRVSDSKEKTSKESKASKKSFSGSSSKSSERINQKSSQGNSKENGFSEKSKTQTQTQTQTRNHFSEREASTSRSRRDEPARFLRPAPQKTDSRKELPRGRHREIGRETHGRSELNPKTNRMNYFRRKNDEVRRV